jgi:hypothetical protein
MSWDRRADLEELMDDPACSPSEVREALIFLRRLNGLSFARRIVAGELRHLGRDGDGRIRLLDVATGGADFPEFFQRQGLAGLAVGLDKNAGILSQAGQISPGITLVQADCFRMPFADKAFDAAVCHLFFHHLNEDEFVAMLREMDRVAQAVVVLDLMRSRWLYLLVGFLAWLGRNRLARHDGPVSVRRAYKIEEVSRLIARAGVPARIRKHPFWRWSASWGKGVGTGGPVQDTQH